MTPRLHEVEDTNRGIDTPEPDGGKMAAADRRGTPGIHLAILLILIVSSLVVSWRRWPDAVVDFGRELYTAWRLSEGAVLYRDVDSFYGPLSQYVNAALFRAFGPALTTLVFANIAVFLAIVFTLYLLLRRAWGAWPAFAAASLFVAVFGASRLLYLGNFNYITPYSHETTHGILLLLLLVACLAWWLRQPTHPKAGLAGLLSGLTLVLKPEIALSAGALVLCAALLHRRSGRTWEIGSVITGGLTAAVPTLAFVGYFRAHGEFADAWTAAGRAWWNVVATRDYARDPVQVLFSGLDHPAVHFFEHSRALAYGIAALAAVWLAGKLYQRQNHRAGYRTAAILILVALALAGSITAAERWVYVARCFLPFLALYIGRSAWMFYRNRPAGAGRDVHATRLLLTVLGATLMARMVLNGRVHQFGYYQAAIAAVVLTAILLREFPARIARSGGSPAAGVFGVAALIAPGVVVLAANSLHAYARLNTPVGTGNDRFFSFAPIAPYSQLASDLKRNAKRDDTLLVLPEGLMLNYLARLPCPVPPFFYYSVVTENGREAELVGKLERHSPEWIVTLPRNLQEYGIHRYGERAGAGADIMRWMRQQYDNVLVENGPVTYSPEHIQIFHHKIP